MVYLEVYSGDDILQERTGIERNLGLEMKGMVYSLCFALISSVLTKSFLPT